MGLPNMWVNTVLLFTIRIADYWVSRLKLSQFCSFICTWWWAWGVVHDSQSMYLWQCSSHWRLASLNKPLSTFLFSTSFMSIPQKGIGGALSKQESLKNILCLRWHFNILFIPSVEFNKLLNFDCILSFSLKWKFMQMAWCLLWIFFCKVPFMWFR